MFLQHQDFPLEADESSRFLPWIVAFMVYLATLALAAAMALATVVDRWDRELSGTLTVQVPAQVPSQSSPAERAAPAANEQSRAPPPDGAAGDAAALEAALEVLRATPGITAAEALAPAEIESLLRPWLGAGFAAAGLPLPAVIDVAIGDGATIDVEALRARLTAAVPGASVDDHALWFDRLAAVAQSFELVAALVVLLTALAAALTVIFVTRSGLSVHHRVIEVLHLIGARDTYIARQFQNHALMLGLRGGVPGLLMAVFTLLLVSQVAGRVDSLMLPAITLAPAQWAALAVLPVGAGIIAMLTARVTVLRTLAGML